MQTPVKAFMSGDPFSIEPDASALAALDLMIERGIRHLPVVDDGRRVVGVLSVDDLRAAFPIPVSLRTPPSAEERPALQDFAVGEVMTHAPVTVRADTPLEEATRRMLERRIGCLPVVTADGTLEGILSETDLLEALASALWSDRLRDERARDEDLETVLREERDSLCSELDRREQLEESVAFARKRLEALEQALARAEKGVLRTCARCDGAITESRLRALPGTTLCFACARKAEW